MTQELDWSGDRPPSERVIEIPTLAIKREVREDYFVNGEWKGCKGMRTWLK